MLQTFARGSVRSHGQALDGFLARAKRLLREGATPEVLSFTKEALEALQREVLPALLEEHLEQTRLVQQHHNATLALVMEHADRAAQIAAQRLLEDASLQAVQSCYRSQNSRCYDRRNCEADLAERWARVLQEEEDLDDLSEEIARQWCEPNSQRTGDGKNEFREKAAKRFHRYVKHRALVRDAWLHYESLVSHCVDNTTALDSISSECDQHLMEFETASCRMMDMARTANDILQDRWCHVTDLYEETVSSVKIAMAARKKEFTTFKTVTCLLEKIEERGGQPCASEEESDEAADIARHCHSQAVNVTKLDIDFPQEPERPWDTDPTRACEAIAQPDTNVEDDCGVRIQPCQPCQFTTSEQKLDLFRVSIGSADVHLEPEPGA